jgi:DNA polymerase-1
MHWNHELAHFILSGGVRLTEGELLAHYGMESLAEVRKAQEKEFTKLPEMHMLYAAVDLPISSIVTRMQSHGVLIDHQNLRRIREELVAKREVLMKRITDRLGPVNTNSPKQLGDALVEKLKVKLPKTKTGQYSTNVWDLTALSLQYPVVQDILDFRAVDKIITTYIDAVLEKVDQEGRIHPQYDLISAATGRLASHEPNIQSTPIGPPYGDMIRGTFVAPPGSVLIAFDYSQQELRILAHLSKDPKLKDAFEKEHDVHQITASRIFDIPKGKVPKELRNIGKTVNFGIIYGQTPYGLSAQLGKSVEECTHILKVYFETYPGVKHYFDNLLIFAKLHGYVETMLGRRRGIPGLPYGKPAKYITQAQERVLKNFPIQGSAADMTKKAMVAIADHVLPKYPDADLVMQIHDELVFEYHSENEAKIEIFAIAVEQCMKDALPLDVPVVVDWKAGGNWGEI